MMIAAKKMIQQQNAIRSRTNSAVDHPPPVSPTASVSSSSYPNNESSSTLKLAEKSPIMRQTSSVRSSTVYTPKTYSPPSTPGRQGSYSELEFTRSSSPPPKSKEKKKKKAFLEAFGKFSISK
jgi:hypothetical protein